MPNSVAVPFLLHPSKSSQIQKKTPTILWYTILTHSHVLIYLLDKCVFPNSAQTKGRGFFPLQNNLGFSLCLGFEIAPNTGFVSVKAQLKFMGAKAMNYCGFGVCRSHKRKTETQAEEIVTNNVRLFSYNSLRSATRDFHPSNKIGGGGFGVVYMGVLRDGTFIAVKRLSAESKQGTKEFLTEINMISKIRHPNLVELIGCCIEGSNRILVYEYLENNSLASALLGSKSKGIFLDWPTRASICMGTASGLAFLHEEAEPPIVHRDIKASNILLDGNFHSKIGDFGLAKLFPDNVTHVSTRVAGTMGYLAPEYALLGQLTKKADVYSFGVLILEILSSRSSSKSTFGVDLLVLVEWAWKLREEGRLLDIVDPELTEYPEDEVIRFIKVALFCTQAASNQRPGMKQVVEMLSKEVILNEKLLTEPGVHLAHTSRGLVGDSSRATSHFVTQMSQMLPR